MEYAAVGRWPMLAHREVVCVPVHGRVVDEVVRRVCQGVCPRVCDRGIQPSGIALVELHLKRLIRRAPRVRVPSAGEHVRELREGSQRLRQRAVERGIRRRKPGCDDLRIANVPGQSGPRPRYRIELIDVHSPAGDRHTHPTHATSMLMLLPIARCYADAPVLHAPGTPGSGMPVVHEAAPDAQRRSDQRRNHQVTRREPCANVYAPLRSSGDEVVDVGQHASF